MDFPEPTRPTSARSYLFVPGDRPERFGKAWESAADEIILDLEDAVGPENKKTARAAVARWLRPERPVWVRCNAADTPWHEDDLQLVSPGLRGFVLPKAEEIPPGLQSLVDRENLRIIPLIETARGMDAVDAIARSAGVQRLAFGSIDFQVDLGIEGEGDALLWFRSRLVLASRLASLPSPIDGVTVELEGIEQTREDTERAKALGMRAKLCIHPKQVPVVHEALQPSEAQREWAARVVKAASSAGGAAITLEGKMVDRPIWAKAMQIHFAPRAGDRLRR
jgi:citrate lyase subunit beta/citryl-CoA lyase